MNIAGSLPAFGGDSVYPLIKHKRPPIGGLLCLVSQVYNMGYLTNISMLPLYISERRKTFRKKHLIVSTSAAFLLAGSLYFFTSVREQTREETPVPHLETATSTLSDWVDEHPLLGAEDIPQPEGEKALPILPPPLPPSMERMKTQGCVADGFLSGYGGDVNSSIALINRSQCYYLHRALETWLRPPDFKLARKIQSKVTKPNTVYGMFIAEAIDTKSNYFYPAEKRDFEFAEMCRQGSKNFWGEHTCKPSLEREEYRKYLRSITESAMDMNVQVFLFGQVFYQDAGDLSHSIMPEVIREMREYADFRGIDILIGAQTNDIADEAYLRQFDFIEGGVGLSQEGRVEEGPCFSRWYEKPGDWCWALLWNQRFKSKANNVFVHFDWSGKVGDDMSVFTRMTQDERARTLRDLRAYFLHRDVGFLMPVLATLHRDNNGCHGAKERFYSASRKYTCQDEDAINEILKSQKP